MTLEELRFIQSLISFLFLFYFNTNSNSVQAQPASPFLQAQAQAQEPHYLKLGPELSRPIAVLILLLVFVFFIVVFLSIYLRYYLELNAASDPERFGMCHGLDPAVIRTFPVVVHSAIKEMKIAKWSLECAVCLSEFQHYETLRLLPKCGHVFHPACIDAWLASCATCPICRAKLAVAGGENSDSDSDSEVLQTTAGQVCDMESGGPLTGSVGGGEKSGDVAGGGEVADN